MDTLKVFYAVLTVAFVFIATVIGCVVCPYLVWCTNSVWLYVLFGVACFLLVVLLLLSSRSNSTKQCVKFIFPLAGSLFLCTLITSLRFEFRYAYPEGDYIEAGYCLYSKFGGKLVDGQYPSWCWGYDGGDKIYINYEKDYNYDDEDNCSIVWDVYDADLNFIERRTKYHLKWREEAKDFLERYYDIMR